MQLSQLKSFLKGCAFVTSLIWIGHVAAASLDSFKTETISSAEGLAEGTINSIIQDSRGFLWFGADNGLSRYDGYRFTLYTHDPADTSSLGANRVMILYEDRDDNLWVGTDGGRVDQPHLSHTDDRGP